MSLRNNNFNQQNRGVSSVVAMAVIILIAIGFAVAIQTFGSGMMTMIGDGPDAYIDSNPGERGIDLTVDRVQNTDELRVTLNGEHVQDIDSDLDGLSPSTGATTHVNYRDIEAESGDQITVVAADSSESERTVFSYEIPDEAIGVPIVQVDRVRDSGQWSDTLRVRMGEVDNVEDDVVYVKEVDSEDSAIVGSNEEFRLDKSGSGSGSRGQRESHRIVVYETSDKDTALCSESMTRSSWHGDSFYNLCD